jgi:hypothetical protein
LQAAVVLPVLLFVVVWLIRGARSAFVGILLPSLVLLPAYYTWKLPGIPVVTFHNYLVAVGFVALICARISTGLRPALTDLLVIVGAAFAFSSEWSNANLHEARNLGAMILMLGLAPYGIGRLVASSDGLLIACIGALTLLGAGVGFASVFEARMGSNPFDFWRGRWPGSVPWDGALYRAGIRRCAGPFAHPICAGFFFSMLLPLWAWLADRKLPFRSLQRILLGAGLLLGLLTSVSRGPMLGAVIGLMIMRVGWSRWRLPIAALALTTGLFGSVLAADKVQGYLSVTRMDAKTESQETAAYRTEMLSNYLEVVQEQPWQGFGRYQVPVIKGQKSIDNQYLFLTLQYGLPHALLFLLALLTPACLLAWRLAWTPVTDPHGRLGWAIVGLLFGAMGTLTTVFAGTQTAQILLLMQGMAVTLTGRIARPADRGAYSQ